MSILKWENQDYFDRKNKTRSRRKKNMKKGGDKSLRTNSAFHSTFDITVRSVQQSLYVTIDGNYTFVIIELRLLFIVRIFVGWRKVALFG